MAYQSTFTANLQPLEQAIKGATPTLNNFEQRTKTVGASLQRMVSEFDGTKLIQQATLLVGSIDKIGGAAKLTEAEQRRVNSTIDEALAKYRVLGAEAPKALVDLFNATKKVEAATAELPKQTSLLEQGFKQIGTVATGVIAGLTFDRVVGAVGRFAAKTIEAGSAVNDLSAKTGVGTTTLQRWQFAAQQNGNTLEQLTGATSLLSKNLVEGGSSLVGAFTRLGLSVDELRGLSPDQVFEQVASAIAKVPDPMQQSALAMEIFGKSGAEILPTLKSDMSALGAEAERLGLVMSESTIKALDDFGDSLDKLELAGQGLLARVFSPMVPILNEIATGALSAANRLDELATAQADLALRSPAAGIANTVAGGIGGTLGTQVATLKLLALALEEVTPPAVRNEQAIAAFGKSVKRLALEVLPADAAVVAMSKTIKAQDATVRGWAQSADAAREATNRWLGRDVIAKANAFVDTYVRLKGALPATASLQREVNAALEAAGSITTTVSPAFRELYINTFGAAVPTLQGFPQYLFDIGRAAESQAAPVAVLTARLKELNDVRTGLPSTLPGQKVDTTIPAPAPRVGERLANLFGAQFGEQIGSAIIQAFAGGGSVTDTVAALVGQKLGQRIGEEVSQSLAKSLGDKGAGLVGGVVGAFAGQALGGLISFGLDKLLKTEGRKVNDLRDQFVGAAGGLGSLNEKAALAGVTLDRLLKANNVKAYTAAVAELEAAFARLEARVTTSVGALGQVGSSGGLITRQLAAEIVALKDRPEIREALGSFLGGQQDRTIGGLDTFLQNSLISSASSARALEGAILSQFGALTAAGASPLEAIQRLQPAIETFGQRTKEVVGFEASGAFRGLQTTVTLLTDAVAGPALTAVGGLGNVLVGLQNQGLLTQEVFGGLARQTFDTFHGLELLGQGGVDAARAMQQPLQRTWELVQDFGFSVDEDTQKLLDFAASSGLIGDQFRPAADKMALGIDRLIGKLDEFVTRLSGPLVNTAYDAARGIEKALNGITPDPIQIDVELVGAGLSGVPGFKHGTDGLVDFGRGTLAVLHGREAVLTEGQLNALAAASQAGTQVTVIVGEERYTSTMLRGARNVLRLQ